VLNYSKLVTGNEYLSFPEINTDTGSISNVTLLHMSSKGLLDLRGKEEGLFSIRITVGNKIIDNSLFQWHLLKYWIPEGILETNNYKIILKIIAPINHKGFLYNFEFFNKLDEEQYVDVQFYGALDSMHHIVNEEKCFDGKYEKFSSAWNEGFFYSISKGFPVISFAPIVDNSYEIADDFADNMTYCIKSSITIEANSTKAINAYWGFGYEEVSAITAARHMERCGLSLLLEETLAYLDKVNKVSGNEKLDNLLNRNLLFDIFFSTGKTIDTEELVIVTSRSPKYYVSAAYWDRDSLLWAFPAILSVDSNLAYEMLMYVSTIQRRNVGIHSRYIDGTVLEPGFELDELCAPIIAIDQYIDETRDDSILNEPSIVKLINKIILQLKTKKSTKLNLYETFLQPTDDMRVHPYLTYNNVLVWKVYSILEKFNYNNKITSWKFLADEVKEAIYKHCIKKINGKSQFIWSVSESDRYDVYDEPPGSLILLPTFGFIDKGDEIYINSIESILDENYKYSFSGTPFGAIGCEHAQHPWILSLANLLRVNDDKEALDKLINSRMDNGIACESIDEYTGISTTGEAFATCAGYLAYSLILHNKLIKKRY
jgi:hypothetical protein